MHRKTAVVVFLIPILLAGLAGCRNRSKNMLNEPAGFRDILWGTPTAAVSGLTPVQNDGPLVVYVRNCDEMTMGTAKITGVEYYFYKDRFCRAVVKYVDLPNYHRLRKQLLAIHGRAWPNSTIYRNDWLWPGETSEIELSFNKLITQGSLTYTYTPIWDAAFADKVNRARSGLSE